jgi:UDP:flavonoid glycosyltransferase YjiC (YdhE family)
MHVTILAYGSRGDVQPYVALGSGLQRGGHTVRLAAPERFGPFVTGYGLEFFPLPGDPTQLMQRMVEEGGANLLRVAPVIFDYALPLGVQVMVGARRACQGTDAIVHSFLMTVAGHEAAVQLGVPDFSALVFAIFARTAAFPNGAFPELPLGGVYNRWTHDVFTQLFWRGNRLAYAWMRRKHADLPPLSTWAFDARNERPTPILYGFSPQVIPKPPDWGEDVHVTGYWFLDGASDWRPPVDLVDFLETGPPPVYVGFGSVITREARRLTETALEALARTGRRGLLLTGWGGLVEADLPEHVFAIDFAPFDWLFPRMAVLVHHGGMGTTAAGLRAGVPAVAVPFTADQPFWGRRLYQLGAGPRPIPRRKLTVERLAKAIRAAMSDRAMREQAAWLGERIRAEDGVGRAIEIIRRYLPAGGA